jgi:MinD-like ATPase involved in chromosome partitioning or flagellar assembly
MPTRVVTVAADADVEARFATALAARADVELVFRCVDRVELLAAIRGVAPDLVVVAGCPPWLDRQACDEAVAARIPMAGLADAESTAEGLARLGILVLPTDASVERVLGVRDSSRALPEAPARVAGSVAPRGRMTAVWGPKGAPGRSSLAIAIAVEMAAADPATVLVDADTYGGDVAQLLGVVEELPTIVWACQAAARDRTRLVEGLRRAGRDGPVLVPGVNRAELWREVGERAWRELLGALRDAFASTVVDTGFCLEDDSAAYAVGEGRNAIAREAVRSADAIVAVCRCDPVGLKTFLWAYQGLAELVDEDRIFVVANRIAPGDEASVADLLRRHAGKRPVAYVPDEPASFRAASSQGAAVRDVAPGSAVVRAVRDLTGALGGRPRPQGVFARLSGRA